MSYTIEIVWNREFDFVHYTSGISDLKAAKDIGEALLDSGDGARVKKYRVLNEKGNVVYPKYN